MHKPEGERQELLPVISAYDPKFTATFVGRHKERQCVIIKKKEFFLLKKTLNMSLAHRIIQKIVEAQQFGSTNAPSATIVLEGDGGQGTKQKHENIRWNRDCLWRCKICRLSPTTGKSRLGQFLMNIALGAGLLVTYAHRTRCEIVRIYR